MNNALLSALLLACTLGITNTATAHDDPQQHCYPLEHGENGLGSTNAFHLPHFFTSGVWLANYYVTNTSDKPVNVKYRFKLGDGSAHQPRGVNLSESFNTGNNPLSTDTGGAILQPGQTGRVRIEDDNLGSVLTGTIHWQADSCIGHALVASARSTYWGSSSFNTTIFLNGGNPF